MNVLTKSMLENVKKKDRKFRHSTTDISVSTSKCMVFGDLKGFSPRLALPLHGNEAGSSKFINARY